MRARRAAWWLFAASLTIGTLSDERLITIPRHVDGFWILAADFHVHSFFGDGALPPWDLRREAERRGLDAIAITNHNRTGTSRLAARLSSQSPGPLLLPGVEITSPRYHLTSIGTEREVDWRQALPAVIDAVHEQGGVAIAAHPAQPRIATFDDDEILKRLDGIEGNTTAISFNTLRSRQLGALYRRATRVNPRISFIGASDFHFLAPLGAYRTYLLAAERTQDGILEAIRNGRTVSCDSKGKANGHADLLRLVGADCLAAKQQHLKPWAQLARWCAWTALVVMVVLTGSVDDEVSDGSAADSSPNGPR